MDRLMPWESTETIPYDEVAEFALELGRFCAPRVTAITVQSFVTDLHKQIKANGEKPYYLAWLKIANCGPSAVAEIFTDETERGRYLRSVAPMRAFATRDERRALFRRVFGKNPNARLV